MKKIIFILVLALLIASGIYYVMQRPPRPTSSKIPVTASFYPMGEFARQVGGDRVQVTTLVRPGVEPHDYDPTPSDMVAAHTSKVLVYNGGGLEPWAQQIAPELRAQGTVVVEAGAGLIQNDPHVWLDPVLAIQEVEAIKRGLTQADPAGAAVYSANAAAYERRLTALDRAFIAGTSTCTNHAIITSHQAFSYLGARYHFQAINIAGLSPDEEPSPQKLSQIAAVAHQNNIKYIFFETLASPRLSQTIASETGAQTLVLNPLEGLTDAEIKAGQNYITVQHNNLENLRLALDCK